MKIPIAKLSPGVSEFDFQEPASTSFPDTTLQFARAISGRLKIDKQESHIYINGFVAATVVLSCDRCLREFDKKLLGEFKLYFETNPNPEPDDGIQDDPDLRVLRPGDQEIDLSGDIRDVLTLSLPMKNVCTDTCKGICSGCGTDLNDAECKCQGTGVDPRWAALEQLRDQTHEDDQ